MPAQPSVLPFYFRTSFSIPFRILARDSSFPNTSIISVAPAGVICLPDTAVRIGHITKPVFTPFSSTYLERVSYKASLD